jgi:hypothetical protein
LQLDKAGTAPAFRVAFCGRLRRRVMSDEKPLCTLVETRAYKHCLERHQIWIWILEAIRDNKWFEEMTPDAPFYAGGLLSALVGSSFDPAKIPWGRINTASEAAFDKWLKKVLRDNQLLGHQKRRPGSKPILQNSIAKLVKDEYPDGPPPDMTNKEIGRLAQHKLGLKKRPCDRTVSRALGRP